METNVRSSAIALTPLFQRLSRTHRERIAGAMQVRDFAAGETLLRQGEPGESLLVVVDGDVSVRLHRQGDVIELAALGPGTVLGEMAIVTGAPRNADAVATRGGRALVLSADAFHGLAAEIPDLLDLMTEVVAARLGRAAADGLGDKVLDGYRVVRPVGRGAMAVVYEARRLADDQRVALKMMSHLFARDANALARFDREASILTQFHHEGITRCHGRFAAYGTLFIVMDFVEGVSLADVIESERGLPPAEARRAFGALLSALAHVHRQGVSHGDVKPANALVDSRGVLRLTDFGIAVRAIDAAADAGRSASGTPIYMAPELFTGAPQGPRSDLYALGVVLAELLTGQPPVEAPTLGALLSAKRRFDSAAFARRAAPHDEDLRGALARLLAAAPEFRVIDADAFERAAGALDSARVARAATAAALARIPPHRPTTLGS